MIADIRALKNKTDFILVYLHFGREYRSFPCKLQHTNKTRLNRSYRQPRHFLLSNFLIVLAVNLNPESLECFFDEMSKRTFPVKHMLQISEFSRREAY